MLSLAVNGYTKEQVMAQLHAKSGSRAVKYRYELLNYNDVKIGELTAQSGNRVAFNSEAEIKRTANFTIKENEAQDIDWLNDRIRPVFCLKMPDGGWAEWPLGVFLLSSPERRETDQAVIREVDAYDPSLIIVEDKFDSRYRITAGTKYTAAIKTILNDAGIVKINIVDHEGQLGVDKEFEIGTPKISAINQLLSEINYTSIWVDEYGYFNAKPYVIPSERDVDYQYSNNIESVIYNGPTEDIDLFNVPNKWVAICSTPEKAELVSRYVNDLSTSKTSTYNRKRIIMADPVYIDDIYDQATLDEYVKRLAYESSWVYGNFSFDTLPMPHHTFQDCLYCEYSRLGIADKYIEISWTMDLGNKMAHNTRRVIRI